VKEPKTKTMTTNNNKMLFIESTNPAAEELQLSEIIFGDVIEKESAQERALVDDLSGPLYFQMSFGDDDFEDTDDDFDDEDDYEDDIDDMDDIDDIDLDDMDIIDDSFIDQRYEDVDLIDDSSLDDDFVDEDEDEDLDDDY
jgi:hypothetical protein